MASPQSKKDALNESQDLSVFVQGMLDEMNSQFTEVEDNIMGRMGAMGKRMDDLERSITDLMGQAGLEAPDNNDSIMSKGSNVASTTNTDNTAVL